MIERLTLLDNAAEQCFHVQNEPECFWDTLILCILVMMMKIIKFWGDLPDIAAKTTSLLQSRTCIEHNGDEEGPCCQPVLCG